jgi:hypothetical protein
LTPVDENASYMAASRDSPNPRGRTLVLAGHGLFMNSMILQRDYDNFLFARNAVRWLAEGPEGRRSHVLLLQDGAPVTRLDLPLKPPPIPWGPLLNTLVDQAQQHGLVEDFVRRNVHRTTIWRWALIVVAALTLPFALRRLLVSRFRRDQKEALLVGLQAPAPPPLPLVELRRQETSRRGNFADSARALARQWLHEKLDAAGDSATTLPRYEIAASWWRRRRLDGNLRWLARLVGPAPPVWVSARAFRRLASSLDEVGEACEKAEIRFVSPAPSLRKD